MTSERQALESAIMGLLGDKLLLGLASEAMDDSPALQGPPIQCKEMTALLHACQRMREAVDAVEVAFFGTRSNAA